MDDLWSIDDRRERWSRLLGLLRLEPGDRVLDIGCGHGEAVRAIARRVGPQGYVVGLEQRTAPIKTLASAASDSGSRLAALVADAEALPFADDTFTAVLCVNVLEAVPDRVRALAEMRRVLRPGGRALVAHDDFESQVFAAADRELSRRIVRAYADSTFEVYATSDGQMGRHLWGIFNAAGFLGPSLHVLPLVNTEYRKPLFGWVHAQFSAEFVAAVSDLTQEDINRWHADLEERHARNEYVYCINMYVCLGHA